MNTNGLARMYDRLTVWKRVPLSIAVQARGDDTEARRLSDASPLCSLRFSEPVLPELALNMLALIYIGEQLEAAASYFFALWRLDDEQDPQPENTNAEAWRRFCAELNINSDDLTAGKHFPRYCVENMPANAPTAAEQQERLEARYGQRRPLVTVDSLLASWRDMLRQATRHAPRRPAEARP